MNVSELGRRHWKGVATAGSVLVFSFVLIVPGAFAYGDGVSPAVTSTTYGGRAYGVWTHVPWAGDATYASTGDLPAQGGVLVADFASVTNGVASGTVFLSYTRGFTDVALGEVATSDVVLLAGTAVQVVAGFAYSRSAATCSGVSGASQVTGLSVGGVPIVVTGAANQIYAIPGVFTLVVNEQVVSAVNGVQSITVNALHATLYGVEVVVSSTSSSIACSSSSGSLSLVSLGEAWTADGPSIASTGDDVSPMCGYPGCDKEIPNDFVTGGGWFAPPHSTRPGRVNFGFNAGPRPGQPTVIKGHLNLIDHGIRLHVQGTNVDAYVRSGDPDDVCRTFAGNAVVNGVPGYRYVTSVCDYGEPGRNDRFVIEVRNGLGMVVYSADNFDGSPAPHGGELDGGNIQLHRSPR